MISWVCGVFLEESVVVAWGGAAIDTGAQGLQGVGHVGVQEGGSHVGLGMAGVDGLQGLGDVGDQGGGGHVLDFKNL